MAYKKTNWQDTLRDAQGNVIQKGTPLNAQALGKIEDGIVAAEQKIDNEISRVTTQLAQIAINVKTKADLVSAIAISGNVVCNISDNVIVDENLTIPENMGLRFGKNSKITVNSGATLTINGYVESGVWEIFNVLGSVSGNIKNERLYAQWFGIQRDLGLKIDQTSRIAKFLSIANALKTEAFFPKGDYYCNEIDLSIFNGKGGITIIGEGYKSEYNITAFYCLDATKIANRVGAFVFLSDTGADTPIGATNREISIYDIAIRDNNTNAKYGLYANGVTFADIRSILVHGFKTGVMLGRQWNCNYDDLEIYHFSEYGLHIGGTPPTNATSLKKIHCSSSKPALANIWSEWGRSFVFYDLTTEGSAKTHVKLQRTNEGFIVFGWHVEGGKNLFELVNETNRFGNVEVYGANIFLDKDSALTDSRLFLFTNCTGVGGISTFTMRGNLRLDANTHADYLSLDRIYSSDIMLNFGVPAPAVDFKNVGSALLLSAETIVTSNITPIGYSAIDYQSKRGVGGNFESSLYNSAVNLYSAPTKILKLKESRGTKRLYFDIEVCHTYDSGAFASNIEYAKFKVGISANGTIGQYLLTSNGTYASALTFSWDNTTQELKAKATQNVGYYEFNILGHKSRV